MPLQKNALAAEPCAVPLRFTGRVGAMDCSTAPLTEPDMRARIRLFGSIDHRASESWSRCLWGVELFPARLERDSRPCEPGRRVGSRQGRPVGAVPSPSSAVRSAGGGRSAHPKRQQVPQKKARTLLLAHDDRPDPAADVSVKNAQTLDGIRRAQPVMRHPSGQVAAERVHAGRDGTPPVRRRHLSDGRRQPSFRLRRQQDADLAVLPQQKAEPQEVHLARMAYGALLRIDLEPHAAGQELA